MHHLISCGVGDHHLHQSLGPIREQGRTHYHFAAFGWGTFVMVVLKQYHYVQLCQPIRDIGWVQTLKQHLWGCALPDPRDAKDEVLGPSHHHSQGAAGGEPPPPLESPEPRRSSGVVRFDLDVKQPE
ncbi:hypothetical protein JOQ06_019128 [Pogonophryne albipinna]|uniref:Uncharacterized protein n=1 Tax=Pogonophryne albipinna TaxID=1090488 RepID=A0AAD6ATW1_9TELE|nr:hypothetical protein JOQ06_019128 [Pogonophryne albipinna]